MAARKSLKPLSDIYAGWSNSLIESAHNAIKEGIAEAKARLDEAPFLLVISERSMHYDMYSFWIRAIEPFQTLKQAEKYSNNWVRKAIPSFIAEESNNSMQWHHIPERDNQILWEASKQKRLIQKRILSFTIEGDPTYYWRRFQLDILSVQTKDIVEAGLFDYFGDEWAWQYYLTGRCSYSPW